MLMRWHTNGGGCDEVPCNLQLRIRSRRCPDPTDPDIRHHLDLVTAVVR